MTVKRYAERDAMALDEAGSYYIRHVMAMTSEGLHSKGDIAAELGWRDMQIDALQQQVNALAAENSTLKSGRKFFMYSDDSGFETFETKEEAINAAQEMIDACREDAYDGWPEEADTIRWGVVIQQAQETDFQKPAPDNDWVGSSDYKLLPSATLRNGGEGGDHA